MTARDKLYNAMAGGWSLTQAEAARLYEVIDDSLATHAHQLAEQIRNRDYDPGAVEPVHLTVQDDADLIDPEAQR